jgi:hypothetical protein
VEVIADSAQERTNLRPTGIPDTHQRIQVFHPLFIGFLLTSLRLIHPLLPSMGSVLGTTLLGGLESQMSAGVIRNVNRSL